MFWFHAILILLKSQFYNNFDSTKTENFHAIHHTRSWVILTLSVIIEWAPLSRLRPFSGNTEKELYGSDDHNNKVERFLYIIEIFFFYDPNVCGYKSKNECELYSFWLKFWCPQTRVTNFLSGRWPCLATLEASNSFPEGSLFVEGGVDLENVL